MSEQAPTRCECGRCEAVVRHEEACVVMGVDLPARDVPMWVCMADTPDEEVLDYFTDGAGCAYCESCGTEMSFNTTGQPVTRRMVPADETEADVAETPQAEYHRLLLAQATWLATNAHAAGKHKVSLHALLTALGEPEDKSLAERIVFLEMEWHDHWSFLIPEYHAGYPAEEHTRSDVAAIIAGRASEMVPRAALQHLAAMYERDGAPWKIDPPVIDVGSPNDKPNTTSLIVGRRRMTADELVALALKVVAKKEADADADATT